METDDATLAFHGRTKLWGHHLSVAPANETCQPAGAPARTSDGAALNSRRNARLKYEMLPKPTSSAISPMLFLRWAGARSI